MQQFFRRLAPPGSFVLNIFMFYLLYRDTIFILEILLLLKRKPLCVSEVKNNLSFSFSTISQYLKENYGLVEKIKLGHWMIYRLKSDNKLMWEVLNKLEK